MVAAHGSGAGLAVASYPRGRRAPGADRTRALGGRGGARPRRRRGPPVPGRARGRGRRSGLHRARGPGGRRHPQELARAAACCRGSPVTCPGGRWHRRPGRGYRRARRPARRVRSSGPAGREGRAGGPARDAAESGDPPFDVDLDAGVVRLRRPAAAAVTSSGVSVPVLPPVGAFADDDGSAEPMLAAGSSPTSPPAARPARRPAPAADRPRPGTSRRDRDETERTESGRTVEKVAQMATVTVTGRDGRRALPVFTSLEPWLGGTRPRAPSRRPPGRRGRGLRRRGRRAAGRLRRGRTTSSSRGRRCWRWPRADHGCRRRRTRRSAARCVPPSPACPAWLAWTRRLGRGGPRPDPAPCGRWPVTGARGRPGGGRAAGRVDLLRTRLERGLDLAAVSV